jgi:hypothetical protein
LESVLRQYGQCIADSSLWIDLGIRLWAGRETCGPVCVFLRDFCEDLTTTCG